MVLFYITSPRQDSRAASAHGEVAGNALGLWNGFPAMWEGCCLHRFQQAHTSVARKLGSRTQPKPFPQDSVISANVRGVGDGRSLERGQRPRDKVWSHKAGCSGFSVHSMAHPKYAPGSNRKAALLARSVLPCSDDSFARCGFLLGLRHHRCAHVR